ncbi:MAG: hypothetical protein VW547_13215, partial [Alphaproteobacteria bacterium]
RMAEREATLAATFAPLPRPSPEAQPEPPPGYWSTGIAVERKADPASDDDTVPPDLAADAVQAVRAAQRAHLDSTRAVEIATRAIVEEVGCDAEEAGSTAFAVIEALNGAGWDPIGGRPVSPDPAAAAAFTGTAQTEARLDIADAADARTVLDALVRFVGIGGTGRRVLPDAMVSDLGDLLRGQLAGKPRETVATINALLRTLPHSSHLTVGLGTSTPEAHALLVSLGGRDRVVDYYGSALHHCCIEIDGIEWRASYTPAPSRPTIAGAAGLDMAARAGGDR